MTDPPGIILTGVSVSRGGQAIFADASLHVPRGRSTAVVGPSGSGKSTLLALISGLEQADSGTVRNPFAAEDTGLVLQAYGLINLLTAAENVEFALQARGRPRAEVRARSRSVLDLLGLSAVADQQVETLSGGQQQRIAVARALVGNPALLIADEFTSELDPANRELVIGQVLSRVDTGGTVIVATHDLELARRCQHVIRLPANGTDIQGGDRAASSHPA